MVYSASSARNLLQGHGDGTQFLVRYVLFGRSGSRSCTCSRATATTCAPATPLLLIVAFGLLLLVLVPGSASRSTARTAGSDRGPCPSSRRS